jgi:peptide/nickel transport system substrate-binding protein
VKGDDWKSLELIFQQWTSSPDPNRATQWFTSAGVGDWNWERWDSEEYTRLNEEAMTSVDEEERDRIYQRMMEVMWEDAAYVPINHVQIGWLVRDHANMNFIPNARVRPRRIGAA